MPLTTKSLQVSRQYRILIASTSDQINNAFHTLLKDHERYHVEFVGNIASARRRLLDNSYDIVIVNCPLPDHYGTAFAMDVSLLHHTVCLLMTMNQDYEEIREKVIPHGVFVLQKPVTVSMLNQAIGWLIAARSRMTNLENKAVSVEEKMKEIRLVNRAKWVLIDHLHMSENEAHRYIEKQAMDRCVTRKEVAQSILQMYE